ncbi:MAG: cysteine-rich small domain-containing protein [Evtepia gabavorous]
MSCYCPLYRAPDCRGSFVMRNGVKDCSYCLLPHNGLESYAYILSEAAGGEDLLSRAGMTYHKTKSPGGTAKAVPPGD